ncbi:MAG: divalent-cation tolerance protein CutA [Candidatus Omnitrophota bacterium]
MVLVTAKNKKEAKGIAKRLIEKRLAACVNIINNVESLFRWQGRIESALEVALIIKTKRVKVPKIIKEVKDMHSYDTPEIISLPISSGFKPYLDWINESIR